MAWGMPDTWVLDIGLWPQYSFCPYDEKTKEIWWGLTMISDTPPGKCLGVVCQNEDVDIEAFVEEHREEIKKIFEAKEVPDEVPGV